MELTNAEKTARLDALIKECAMGIFELATRARAVKTVDPKDTRLQGLEDGIAKLQQMSDLYEKDVKDLNAST